MRRIKIFVGIALLSLLILGVFLIVKSKGSGANDPHGDHGGHGGDPGSNPGDDPGDDPGGDDCSDNQYKDADGCQYCTQCDDNETIVKACSSTSDTKCQKKCAESCKDDQICDDGTCKTAYYTCDLGSCNKTSDSNAKYKSFKECSDNCKIVMTGDCKDNGPSLKPWITPPLNNDDTNKGIQHWLSNVIDPLAIWVPESQTIGGIKDGGPSGGKTQDNIKAVCPYGMYFDSKSVNNLNNSTPGNLFKDNGLPSDTSPCQDYKPDGTCSKWMLNQCLDTNPKITPPNPLPNIYMTWFEIPTNIKETSAITYINLLLEVCKKTQDLGSKNGNGNGIRGLCFPMVTWPDQNNMTWLNTSENNTSAEKKRNALGKWICDYFLKPCQNNNVAGGLLLYTNFKDGPWANGFYKQEALGNSKLINPITNKPFKAYECATGSTSSNITACGQFIWGAFIHFVNTYIIPNYDDLDWLGSNLWFHVDKEGCSCGLPSDYIGWMEEFIGKGVSDFKKSKIGTRMLLATGIGTAGEGAKKSSTDKTVSADNLYNSISVPENYWSAGNQLPCGGDSGSYFHAMSACTNLNTHRRLANYPTAYQNLIVNQGDKATNKPSGSDCAAGWLGSGKWAAEMETLKKKDPKVNLSTSNSKGSIDIFGPDWVWPSFSIENLSLCDLNDPNCYSQYTKVYNELKAKNNGVNPDPNHLGLRYDKVSNNTTLCLNMLFGADENTQPSQGTRACGVFDGFSFWSWEGMNDYLNLFCNQSGAKNVIVYEASFIPYHWLVELGIQKPDNHNFQLLPAPITNISCKNDKDCQDPKTYLTSEQQTFAKNIVCLGPDMKKVSEGKDGFCKNLCLVQPAGLGKLDQNDNTIWVTNKSDTEAQAACTTYYSNPKGTIKGTDDQGKKVSFTNPFNTSCIGDWPGGYVQPKTTTGNPTYYNCQYHTNKLAVKKTPKKCPTDLKFTQLDKACPSSIPSSECGKSEDCDNYLKSINCGDNYYGICKSNCDCQFKLKQKPPPKEQVCISEDKWNPPSAPSDCKDMGKLDVQCGCDEDCLKFVNSTNCKDFTSSYCKVKGDDPANWFCHLAKPKLS